MADAPAFWSSSSIIARGARALLLPASALFRAGVAVKNAAYDAHVLGARELGAPSVSVGNLSVGGTGKTPFASWVAHELARRGAHPAILLRGYGADEVLVHEALAPDAVVVADADRVRGAAHAKSRGADVLVLDDAFQHRRVRRDADIVLLSADAVSAAPWPLPAGPWREGLHALARARLVFVTRKTAGAETAGALASHVARHTKMANPGIVHIAPGDIVRWGTSERAALSSFAGRAVFAVSAIGDPAAFEGQLRNAALRIEAARYPDHHAFTEAHVESLMARAGRADAVVSTLKDAVKLGPLWPRTAPPLWYLSQHVIIERGQESLAALIAELVALRRIG